MLFKTMPLYLNVLFGYLASKKLNVSRDSVATLLVYIIGPVVVFFATVSVKIDLALASLPIMFFTLSSIVAIVVFKYMSHWWKDSTGNILAFTAGTGNTGFFGIPLAMVLLPKDLADVYVFAVLSSLLYESTTGFYVTAKGNFSTKEVFNKLSKLPLFYAFIVGITFNLLGFEIPKFLEDYGTYFKGAYGILGMMMLGMGLDGIKGGGHFDLKFINIALFSKFIFWPILMLGLIALDFYVIGFMNQDFYVVAVLFALVPLAGNTVTYAVLLNANPEKASVAVFISTLIAIVYIPLMLVLTKMLPFPIIINF